MSDKKRKNAISFFNSHFVTVVSISLVLFLLGLILIIVFTGSELSRYMRENLIVSVILDDGISDAKIKQLRSDFEKMPCVKSTEFISKEQAAAEMQKELGENPEAFLGFNPFHPSLEVRLNADYTHPDSLLFVEKKLAEKVDVTQIDYRKDMMQMVNNNIRRVSFLLLSLLVILVLISFVLINNTVKLLIYSKRFLIYTMRLVGATPEFIRRPFLNNNIVCGLVAGAIAIILLMFSLLYLKQEFLNIEEVLSKEILLLIYLLVIAAGIIISVTAAYFAVNRYLKMSRGKMYYV